MKKIIAILMSCLILIGFTGCGGPSAEEVLKEHMDILCCKDENKVMEKYINGEEVDEQYEKSLGKDLMSLKASGLDAFMLSMFQNLDYEINSVEENKDSATAKVTFKTIDFGKAYEKAVKKTISWFKNNLSASSATLTNKIMENFTKEINKAGKSEKNQTKTVTFLMSKGDDGWEIINGSSALNEVFSDIESEMTKVNANIESYF